MIEDRIKEGSVSIGKTGLYLKATTGKGYHINFNVVQLPELKTIGVSNITRDQSFILFLDYDRITIEQLHDQINFLFKQYGMTHALIITTGKDRYHVINFEKFLASDIQKIVNNTVCDYSFKTVALKSDKGWILRLYPKLDVDGNVVKDKPEFLDFIINDDAKNMILNGKHRPVVKRYGWFDYSTATVQTDAPKFRELSRAHLELFAKIYPDFLPYFQNSAVLGEEYQDSFTDIHIVKYGTSAKNLMMDFDFGDLVNSKKINVIWEEEIENNVTVESPENLSSSNTIDK